MVLSLKPTALAPSAMPELMRLLVVVSTAKILVPPESWTLRAVAEPAVVTVLNSPVP